MFPVVAGVGNDYAGFPRVRGDVPARIDYICETLKFSPRARGCSRARKLALEKSIVFPACAGMFRFSKPTMWVGRCFPRVRGDVPGLICVG